MTRHACEQLTLAEQIRRNLVSPVRVSLRGISCDVATTIDEVCLMSHIFIKASDSHCRYRVAISTLSEDSAHAMLWPLHYVYFKQRSNFGTTRDHVAVKSSDVQAIIDGIGSYGTERLVVSMIESKYTDYGDHFTCVKFKYDVCTQFVHATRYDQHCSFRLDKILVDGNIKGELLMREIVSGLSS